MKIPAVLRRKNSLVYGVLALFILGGVLAISYWNMRPVAIVNGHPVSLRRYNQNLQAALVYSANVKKTYQASSTPTDDAAIRADVLTRLIQAELVREGATEEAGKDMDYLLANKLDRYKDNDDLRKASTILYGMDYASFWNEVLVPQAERDILAGRLFLKGENVEQWLATAKKDANVILLADGMRWNGAQVEVAK